jgi:hypothetical protein
MHNLVIEYELPFVYAVGVMRLEVLTSAERLSILRGPESIGTLWTGCVRGRVPDIAIVPTSQLCDSCAMRQHMTTHTANPTLTKSYVRHDSVTRECDLNKSDLLAPPRMHDVNSLPRPISFLSHFLYRYYPLQTNEECSSASCHSGCAVVGLAYHLDLGSLGPTYLS